MKKKLNEIFDEAKPQELNQFSDELNAPGLPDEVLASVKGKVYAKTNLKKEEKNNHGIWMRFGAIAACLLLILSAAIVALKPREGKPDSPNIPIVDVRVPSSAPQYYGSELSAKDPSGSTQACISLSGISVTARFAEVLPDTYTFYDDWRQIEFRLIRMEVITALVGTDLPGEFLFIIPTSYMTDYSLFDKFVFENIAQYGYEYSVVYNKTQGCAEQLELFLFGYRNVEFSSLGMGITAFDSDDRFDMRLWESTDEWKTSTRSAVELLGAEYFQTYTLQVAEEKARSSEREGYSPFYVHSLADVNGEAADALNYIKSFGNGLYVPTLSGMKLYLSPEVQFGFRRYINGFATNEYGMIYEDEVIWSKARFSKEDEKKLPNLQAAVTTVISDLEAGKIKPSHIQNVNQEKMRGSGVFGWYAKTANGIIGVVRVTWLYVDIDLRHHSDGLYFDDAYYVIEYGSDECVPIDRDALLDKIGADYDKSYIFEGKYDGYGKARVIICF